ncbi:MAG: response regulator transcription factor [Treponema sp.]|jgi:NarL family two-component system response regulator LiaR|nr:response regulator transcription factor [Treponema sp.]
MIRIVLIDDHPLAVKGIGAWLTGTGRFTIAGTAGTAAAALELLESLDPLPDIVILDIALGGEDGLAVIPVLKQTAQKRKAPLPGIVVCSMYEDPFLIQNALEAGAGAYITKSADIAEILTAIDAVLAGETYVNPAYEIPARKWASAGLSTREREIVALIKQSLNNKQIAKMMGISIRTVENHLSHIYIKTNTYSRSELAER